MRKLKVFLSALLITVASVAFAQNITVTGVVTDASNGEPLSGAAILVKGTPNGVVADNNGRYSISVSSDATLGFTTIGFKDSEVQINGRTEINVELEPDSEMLTETVVVAYGSQSAKKVTASVASIKAESLKDLPNASFDGMLQGQAAGVQASSANAGSGQKASIHIRGISSISGGTEPLYIVDGVAITSSPVNTSYTDVNPLADINPGDILSIEILKDAAATALYGSRAANGVIMITTKSGRKGQTSVTYDGAVGFQQATKLFDMMDAEQYTRFKNQAIANLYGTSEVNLGGGANVWGKNAFNLMKDQNGNIINTNWNKQIYQNGFLHSHTVAVQGGTDKVQYYASTNYADQNGIVMGDKYQRIGVKANVTSDITSWLKIGINSQFSHGKTMSKDGSRIGSVFAAAGLSRQAMIIPPSLAGYGSVKTDTTGNPYFDTNDKSYYTMNGGQYIGTGGIRLASLSYPNPMTANENFNTQLSDRIIASAFAQVTPVKNLHLKTQFGIDYTKAEEETFWDPAYGQGAQYPGYAWRTYSNNTDWTWTNTADYGLHLGDHSFDFLLGMEAYSSSYDLDFINASEILNPMFDGFKAGYSKYESGGEIGSMSLISYFGRVNYDYKAKYMISANYRRDGLSSLGSENKWGDFWGVSAAWRISEEKWFQPIRNALSELKLKASYGVVGNSQIGFYGAQSYYSSDYAYGGKAASILANIGDSNLAWESSAKLDVGLEFSLFNVVNVGLDYYDTSSKNLVMAVPQGPSTGIGSLITNTGSMRNRGIELTVSADVIRKKNFNWYTSFNFTTVDNKVLSLADGVTEIFGSSESNITLPGYSMGQLYLYPTGGIDPATGRRVFFGANGERTTYDPATKDFYLDDGSSFQGSLAQVRAGNTIPTWFGGWTNTFSFYGFDINLLFQFSGGNWIFNGNSATGSDMRWWNNFKEVETKCWQKSGDNAKYAKPYYGDNVSNGSAYDITDWIERGDYLRLKNISAGYTFKFNNAKQSGVSSLRLYAQVQNAFVFTAYTGLDPEITSSYTNDAIMSSGYDKNTLPQARTYTFGVQLKF